MIEIYLWSEWLGGVEIEALSHRDGSACRHFLTTVGVWKRREKPRGSSGGRRWVNIQYMARWKKDSTRINSWCLALGLD